MPDEILPKILIKYLVEIDKVQKSQNSIKNDCQIFLHIILLKIF